MLTKVWQLALVTMAMAGHAVGLPTNTAQIETLGARALPACTSLKQRVNWNALSDAQKQAYFDAVKCLQTKPAQSGIEAAKTLYDDFTAIHIQNNHQIHFVAAFLPWHRRYVQARERALESCGYQGPTPYWDWTQGADTGNPQVDPVLSAEGGFGGNGDANRQWIVDQGPFANLTVNLVVTGDDKSTPSFAPHELTRDFRVDDTSVIGAFSSKAVAYAQAIEDFNDYRTYLESVPHGGVHRYISGDMGPVQSPNEPLFFLHHAQVDRLWTLWQKANPQKRNTEYVGNLPGADDTKGPFDASLDDMLPPFGNLIDPVPVRDVMDTEAGDLCYEVSKEHTSPFRYRAASNRHTDMSPGDAAILSFQYV